MSIYQNIFHYYRGQTKNSSKKTQILQIENNVTKAFLNVLQHSSNELTTSFINMLDIDTNSINNYEYRYQVSSPLSKITTIGVVVGIAENKEIRKGVPKEYGIPDGAIISNNVSILIENKIGYNSFLDQKQLERHKGTFAKGQKIMEEPLILSWQEVRCFFRCLWQTKNVVFGS
ncbi:hypothetical protein GCM10008986_31520 [Salinibacillus aidingensis]|uniref:GerA spore germination protein n=1 Tax=Salinibacillus aidingensis TaxID=237684 RepID=A0ABP3LP38_9BACI